MTHDKKEESPSSADESFEEEYYGPYLKPKPGYTRRLIPMIRIPADEIDENFDEVAWNKKVYGADIIVVDKRSVPEGYGPKINFQFKFRNATPTHIYTDKQFVLLTAYVKKSKAFFVQNHPSRLFITPAPSQITTDTVCKAVNCIQITTVTVCKAVNCIQTT